MNRYGNVIFALVMMVSFIGCTQSQDRPGFERGQNRDPEEMVKMQVERMNTALELTEDQKKEITELYLGFNKKQVEARDENRGDREAMQSVMQEINQEREKELKNILDESQWTKWQEVREQFQRRRGQRRPGGES